MKNSSELQHEHVTLTENTSTHQGVLSNTLLLHYESKPCPNATKDSSKLQHDQVENTRGKC